MKTGLKDFLQYYPFLENEGTGSPETLRKIYSEIKHLFSFDKYKPVSNVLFSSSLISVNIIFSFLLGYVHCTGGIQCDSSK
jgi:hypothetical protein